MLRNVVLKQKNEKEHLLSLSYVERTKSRQAGKWLDSDLIKVVLGPRRAGKSVFALTLLHGRPFMYVNFDDEWLFRQDQFHYDDLMKELHVAYGPVKTVLFDEIQNVPAWELWINRLHREGYNIVMTGSNANLLSRELASALTGRHMPIEILPFDFREFLRAKDFTWSPERAALPEAKAALLTWMDQYLISGGFPEVVVKGVDPHGYLSVLFDSVLFKDVVRRHKVRYSEEIGQLGSYVMSNVSNLHSFRKLTQVLHFRSGVTLEKYLRYLTEAYLVFLLRRYSAKAGERPDQRLRRPKCREPRERLTSPQKAYAVDNGFVSAKAVQHSPDQGRLMENLVFVELVKRGWEPNRGLFYYKTRNDREVDFALRRATAMTELIQVAYQTQDEAIERREIKALLEASDELGTPTLTVLTWDEAREVRRDGKTFHFTPLWHWLMQSP